MENSINVVDLPNDGAIGDRERLLAKARLALLAGYIVKLGTRVIAFRTRGQAIDDGGETIYEALGDGLYERMKVLTYDKDGEHQLPDRWMLTYDGADLYRLLKSIIDDLDDYKVKFHLIGFVFAFANAPARDRARLHLGLPISDPPTTVLS
jgi:hypothetical protein